MTHEHLYRAANPRPRVPSKDTSTSDGRPTAAPTHELNYSLTSPSDSASGEPLPASTRRTMEASFGSDFSTTRVHEDATAARIGAFAFTRGEHIYFAPGHFRPDEAAGRRLLRHELVHVVQQREGRVRADGQMGGLAVNRNETLEREADVAAEQRSEASPASASPQPANVESRKHTGPPVVQGFFGYTAAAAATLGLSALAYFGLPRIRDAAIRRRDADIRRRNPAIAALVDREKDPDRRNFLADVMANDDTLSDASARPADGVPAKIKTTIPQNVPEDLDFDAQDLGEHGITPRQNGGLRSELNYQQVIEQNSQLARAMHARMPVADRDNIELSSGAKYQRHYATPAALKRMQTERIKLLAKTHQKTNEFKFDKFDAKFSDVDLKTQKRVLANAPHAAQQLKLLTRDHEGFALGESHNDSRTKKFLTKHMQTLRKSGVGTLYLEHIRSEYQPYVDDYVERGKPMHPVLSRFLEHSEEEAGTEGLRDILDGARKHKMRVKGIDTMAAQSTMNESTAGIALRDATMNTFARGVIEGDSKARKEMRGRSKYVILAGAAHTNTQKYTNLSRRGGLNKGIPGLSQLLGVPALKVNNKARLVTDREKKQNRIVQQPWY